MPLYDLQCKVCGSEFEGFAPVNKRHDLKCKCGGKAKVLITNYRSSDWFKPHINENFNGEPIEVKSRSHMKELCLKYNVTSRALGDVR